MSIKFKQNSNWEVLSFSLPDLTKLNNDIITRQFKSKYKDFDSKEFDIIDVLTSTNEDRLSGKMNVITICFNVTNKTTK